MMSHKKLAQKRTKKKQARKNKTYNPNQAVHKAPTQLPSIGNHENTVFTE